MAYRKGTQGMMQVDYEQRMDFNRMREYRIARIKEYMDVFDIECLLLFDTGNKRYSTSTAVCSPEIDNMGRYAIIPRNGPPGRQRWTRQTTRMGSGDSRKYSGSPFVSA